MNLEEEIEEIVKEEAEMPAQHLEEEEALIEEEQVLWETDYEDLIYLIGGSAFYAMEAEVLRLVEEAIKQIAEEWEADRMLNVWICCVFFYKYFTSIG